MASWTDKVEKAREHALEVQAETGDEHLGTLATAIATLAGAVAELGRVVWGEKKDPS